MKYYKIIWTANLVFLIWHHNYTKYLMYKTPFYYTIAGLRFNSVLFGLWSKSYRIYTNKSRHFSRTKEDTAFRLSEVEPMSARKPWEVLQLWDSWTLPIKNYHTVFLQKGPSVGNCFFWSICFLSILPIHQDKKLNFGCVFFSSFL